VGEAVEGWMGGVGGDYIGIRGGTFPGGVPAAPGGPALVTAAGGHIRPPRRYLSQYGQFLEHAPYSERDLRGPDGPLLAEGEDVPVVVRTRAGLTRLTYARHPFDVVGWDGCLYPFALNIADFEPVVKRTHAPPPVPQTFKGPTFVICSFRPRPLDFHPEAVPIPYNHHNVDSDEMMFYVGGDYTARQGSGVGLGSITLHPGGFTHGPQPGAVEAAVAGLAEGKTTTDETAVMIDTFRPLGLGPAARRAEDPHCAWTWARAARRRPARQIVARSAGVVAALAVFTGWDELEHGVAGCLADEVRHRGVHGCLEVRSRGRGDADVSLQDGSGLVGGDLPDGVVTGVAPAGQAHPPRRAGGVHPGHRPGGGGPPAPPPPLPPGHRGGARARGRRPCSTGTTGLVRGRPVLRPRVVSR